MIVMDAGAALSALLNAGPAREMLAESHVCVTTTVDIEIDRRLWWLVSHKELSDANALAALDAWTRVGVDRYSAAPLARRIWRLRETAGRFDVAALALAEVLECGVITVDPALAAAAALPCPVTVLSH